jgi:LuxR family maltose regulon positive regulatory protein
MHPTYALGKAITMTLPVLSTKLYAPPLRTNWVKRNRLIQRIEDGAQQGRRLTLISAPAGFGKTTLVSEWMHADHFDRQSVWLSLDQSDNDPLQVLHYLIAALKQTDPSIGASVETALQSRQPPPIVNLIGLLINDIAAAGKQILLVLDDYHQIQLAEVHQMIEHLLERQPQTLHLAILTRQDPPLPLPRLRARGQITEIRERDLRFSESEAESFFHQTMGLDLQSSAINTLATRTEGWIAGMQLAAIALQEATDDGSINDFITTFAGSDRYIVDYLVTEVLNSQPERVSEFLMKTSILDRLCSPLCDAILTESGQPGEESQEILDSLERMNMFIVPLDNQRKWYRYHHLFGDLLRLRLDRRGKETVHGLHQRAAEWLGANGLIDEAIHHALAAENTPFAAGLVNRNWRQAQHEGRPKVALKWIEMLPKEWVASNALLSAANAWTMYLLGRTDAVLPHVYDANRALAALVAEGKVPEDDFEYYSLPGQMFALQALIALRKGEAERGRAFAHEAIRTAPPQDVLSLGLAWSALGGSYREGGNLEEAIPCYYQAIEKNTQSGNIIAATIGGRHLGRCLQIQGQLKEAEQVYQSILNRADEKGQLHLPAYGMIFVALAEIYYERNELEKARSFLDKGLELGQRGGYVELFVASAILEARLRKVNGDLPGAVDALQKMYESVRKADEPLAEADVVAWLSRMQAETGDQARLLQWVEELTAQTGAESGQMRWMKKFSLVRLLISLQRWEEAFNLCEELEKAAADAKSVGRQIEALMLQAENHWLLSRKEPAAACLNQSLCLAEPRGYLRLFLDEGPRLEPVLAAMVKRPIDPEAHNAFSLRLLKGFPTADSAKEERQTPGQLALVDPLSDREIEVLRLLVQGLTLAEIAKKLYLSPNTLKAHTQNIYSKLDAHSRVEAANKARELGFIS